MRIFLVFGFILALAGPGHASVGLWANIGQAVFRLYVSPDTRTAGCTAWATAPADRARDGEPQTYYITAGHCRPAQYVSDAGRFLRLPLLASSNTFRLDVSVGIRPDHRHRQTFLPLDPAPARPGDRVLAIGFPNGTLMSSVMTVAGAGPDGLVLLRSPIPVAGGWSGAPLVSLATGRVIGILADSLMGESYLAMAVPATTISAFLSTVEPQALGIPTAPRPIGRIPNR
jgi:hypothetical protein